MPLRSTFTRFFQLEAASGLLLIAAAVLALVINNSPLSWLYNGLLDTPVVAQVGALKIAKPLLLWINDGLMALFFLLIGLEVKPKVLRMIDNQIGDGPNAINDVQKALENPDNLRIKTLAVSYTATRTDAMKTPIPLVAYSSRAALSNSCKLLNIELKYGMDQNTPLRVEFKDTLPSARIRELNPEQLDQKIRHGRSPLM